MVVHHHKLQSTVHFRLFFLFLVWSNLFVCNIWIELELLISIDFRRFIFGEPFDLVSLRSISFSIFVCNASIRLKYKVQTRLETLSRLGPESRITFENDLKVNPWLILQQINHCTVMQSFLLLSLKLFCLPLHQFYFRKSRTRAKIIIQGQFGVKWSHYLDDFWLSSFHFCHDLESLSFCKRISIRYWVNNDDCITPKNQFIKAACLIFLKCYL